MLLGTTADHSGAIGTRAPIITGHVAPLQDALAALQSRWKFVNLFEDNSTSRAGIIPATKNNPTLLRNVPAF